MKVYRVAAAVLLIGATATYASNESAGGNLRTVRRRVLLLLNLLQFHRPRTSISSSPNGAAQNQDSAATTANPAQSVTAGAAPLRVMVGKSLLIIRRRGLKRVSVNGSVSRGCIGRDADAGAGEWPGSGEVFIADLG